jgi:hypothetical protein
MPMTAMKTARNGIAKLAPPVTFITTSSGLSTSSSSAAMPKTIGSTAVVRIPTPASQ